MKYSILMLCVFIWSLSSFTIMTKRPDFSGLWKFNIEKSDLGKQPESVAAKQLKVKQNEREIAIERDSVYTEVLRFNGEVTENMIYQGQVKKSATVRFSDDRKKLVETANYTFEKSGQSDEYKVIEEWSLSDAGNILTIIRKVESKTNNYSIKAVYDKK